MGLVLCLYDFFDPPEGWKKILFVTLNALLIPLSVLYLTLVPMATSLGGNYRTWELCSNCLQQIDGSDMVSHCCPAFHKDDSDACSGAINWDYDNCMTSAELAGMWILGIVSFFILMYWISRCFWRCCGEKCLKDCEDKKTIGQNQESLPPIFDSDPQSQNDLSATLLGENPDTNPNPDSNPNPIPNVNMLLGATNNTEQTTANVSNSFMFEQYFGAT